MGRAFYSLLLMGVFAGLMACQRGNDSGEASGQVALTPNSADCLVHGYGHDGRCNTDYAQYGNGFQNYQTYNGGLYGQNYYGHQNNFQDGFCGCPSGYQPTYNAGWGLGCVRYDASYQYQYWNYNYYSSSQAALNIQQTGYQNTNQNGCYQSVSYACDTRTQGACGHGGFCRAVGGAGYMGVCTYDSHYTTKSGGANYNQNHQNPYNNYPPQGSNWN